MVDLNCPNGIDIYSYNKSLIVLWGIAIFTYCTASQRYKKYDHKISTILNEGSWQISRGCSFLLSRCVEELIFLYLTACLNL